MTQFGVEMKRPQFGRQMNGQAILLRVAEGPWEGWTCMDFGEFLKRIDLNAWDVGVEMVGIVLSAV
jgi:hypothetical protein